MTSRGASEWMTSVAIVMSLVTGMTTPGRFENLRVDVIRERIDVVSGETGMRAGLPDDVLVAAREVAEQDGIDGLTMRRLAAALGVAPNTLYSHFADKAALIDAVLDSRPGPTSRPSPSSDSHRASACDSS